MRQTSRGIWQEEACLGVGRQEAEPGDMIFHNNKLLYYGQESDILALPIEVGDTNELPQLTEQSMSKVSNLNGIDC